MQIIQAAKSDKKAVLSFYRTQHYSARYLGFDKVYLIKQQQKIIASAMISQIIPNSPYNFLHALVIDSKFRKQGLATLLLKHIALHHSKLICFANSPLAALYQKIAMTQQTPEQIQQLPQHLQLRYSAYLQNQPALNVYANN